MVNLPELSFGILAGISAGVFIKKGAKAVAFFVGGIFVLLQVSSDYNRPIFPMTHLCSTSTRCL